MTPASGASDLVATIARRRLGTCIDPGLKTGNAAGQARPQTSNTWSNGYFLQDSWTIANVLTLNFGVRLDTQNMQQRPPAQPLADYDAAARHQRHLGAPRPGHLGLHRQRPRQDPGQLGHVLRVDPPRHRAPLARRRGRGPPAATRWHLHDRRSTP